MRNLVFKVAPLTVGALFALSACQTETPSQYTSSDYISWKGFIPTYAQYDEFVFGNDVYVNETTEVYDRETEVTTVQLETGAFVELSAYFLKNYNDIIQAPQPTNQTGIQECFEEKIILHIDGQKLEIEGDCYDYEQNAVYKDFVEGLSDVLLEHIPADTESNAPNVVSSENLS